LNSNTTTGGSNSGSSTNSRGVPNNLSIMREEGTRSNGQNGGNSLNR
jgi:hypothetical protein